MNFNQQTRVDIGPCWLKQSLVNRFGLKLVSIQFAREITLAEVCDPVQSTSNPSKESIPNQLCAAITRIARYGTAKIFNRTGSQIAVLMDHLKDLIVRRLHPLPTLPHTPAVVESNHECDGVELITPQLVKNSPQLNVKTAESGEITPYSGVKYM